MKVSVLSPPSSPCLQLKLVGSLTEENRSLIEMSFDGVTDLEVDLSEFVGLNSIGLVHFMRWMKKCESMNVRLSHCPKLFIDQVNMIRGILPPKTKIFSFYVPFISDENDETKSVLYSFGKEYRRMNGLLELHHPTVTASGGENMEMDVVGSKFFKFLEQYT